jgi:translation initiation factor IF-1
VSRGGQHHAREQGRRGFPECDVSEGQCTGVVVNVARGDLHAVDVTIGQITRRALCRRSGRLKTRHIHLLAGDRCTVELDAYDPTKGRIVRRLDGPKGAA